ncbi:MAG: peptidylprolyl isomerase [Lachnospiraceae bacterium]|nr:peptidylprolyl isomerase [Lachnospiraceae bacterium]
MAKHSVFFRMKRLVLLAAVCLLCGCTIGGKEVFFSIENPFTVFSIGPLSCGIKETRVYLANYKNIYGTVGMTDLWSEDFDMTDIEEGIRRSAIYHLSRVYSLDLYARESGIVLDDNEKSRIATAAREYYESLNDEERRQTGVHLHDIRRMYEHYVLAEKVYFEMMKSVDEEVSEDEARIMDALVLYVRSENTIQKIRRQLDKGEDFEALLSRYSEGEKGEVSFGRGTYPKKVEQVAFTLEDGEVSESIAARDGYYIIKCTQKYDEALSEENKNRIIEERKQEVFRKIIKEQSDKYYSRINTRLVDKIHIDLDSSIHTDSFFSTIEAQLSYH